MIDVTKESCNVRRKAAPEEQEIFHSKGKSVKIDNVIGYAYGLAVALKKDDHKQKENGK
jgi:hypothetical protein